MRRDLVTTAQAAVILNCKSDNVRRLAREGQLRAAITSPLGRLFTRAAVERLAAERRARSEAAAAQHPEQPVG